MIDADAPSPACRRRLAACAAALGLLATTAPVLAQEHDPAAAEALFREGKQLMADGNFERACPKLAASYRLDPATGALLATALCYERAGKLASAWAAYTDAASRAKNEGALDREQSARAKAAELEPKLDRLVVHVVAPETPGLVVTRDGVEIGQAEWGTPIPVDAGSHVVEARASGRAGFRAVVNVRGAGTQRVSVPELKDLPRSGASAPATPESSPASDHTAQSPGFWTPLRAAGVIVAGVGVAGLAVGGVFGARALSLKADSEADGHCNAESACDPEGTRLRNDARDAGNVSTIAVIGGLALTAGGIALFALGAPDDPAAGLWVTPPVAGNGSVTFRASF
jgi:hypothetical protein